MVNGAILDGKSRMQEESKVSDTQRPRRRLLASYYVHPHLIYLTSVGGFVLWLEVAEKYYGEVGGAKLKNLSFLKAKLVLQPAPQRV